MRMLYPLLLPIRKQKITSQNEFTFGSISGNLYINHPHAEIIQAPLDFRGRDLLSNENDYDILFGKL